MKKLIVLAVLAAAVYFLAWPPLKVKLAELMPAPEAEFAREARARSNNILLGMEGASDPKFGPPEQFALCQWAKGKIAMDREAIEFYASRWDSFRQSKGLYRTIRNHEILGVSVSSASGTPTAVVDLRIDGGRYKWRVSPDEPIVCAD